MNERDRLEWFSMQAAGAKVAKDTSIKAAVIKGRPPITDDPFAKARLFDLVKDADAVFRAQRDILLEDGWEIERGTLAAGILIFGRDHEVVGLLLDKRRKGA